MNKIVRVNQDPLDHVQLFRKQEIDNQIIYHALSWEAFEGRILHAHKTQEFDAIYPVLIRTVTEPLVRYYPLPRLLNNSSVPYYAEDAYKRVHDLLGDVYTLPLAKVAMVSPRPTTFAKVAMKIRSFFRINKGI